MAEEQQDQEQDQQKSMIETIMSVPGTKVLGPPSDKKKAAERLLNAHADRPSYRKESIMEKFEDSINHAPKSIGERLEGSNDNRLY
ncbi:MAG: hypothetical protein ACT4OM_02680 [Actinomycetota bacterium]